MLFWSAVVPRFPSRKLVVAPSPLCGSLVVSLLLFSCSSHPQQPAVAAATGKPAPRVSAAAPPPPPPPKCESLSENCAAVADTKLFVGESGAWFTPPAGWHYARTPDGSVTVHPDGTAIIVLMPSPDPSDIAPAVEMIVSQRGVTGLKVDKLKRRLKKPQQTLQAGPGTVDLWEVDKVQQGESLVLADKGKGTLLVLVGKPEPDHTLLGIGFVVESAAEAEAPKIMASVQTLRGKP